MKVAITGSSGLAKNIKDTPHKEVRNELENLEDDIPF